MPLTIWWIRRDLRLHDNQALQAALSHNTSIIPLFILDPALLRSRYVGAKRLAFLFGGLRDLDRSLSARGSRLIIRHGTPLTVLKTLHDELDITAIYAEEDISPYARERDTAIQQHLQLHLTPGVSILPIGSVRKDDGLPYTVYTPFNRRWQATCSISPSDLYEAPRKFHTPQHIASEAIPTTPAHPSSNPFPPGEAEANHRFDQFVQNQCQSLYDYAQYRNRPDVDGTSQLSPYIRFGMISVRRLALAAQEAVRSAPHDAARQGAQTWLDELLWREFFQSILHFFPHVRTSSYFPKYDGVEWRNDDANFAAWCEGRTGYPYIDAAMRQLAETGWMHNRARMAVASFLTKDLLIDWRWGEQWFMQQLLDGDPASNNGGWQWTAGSGPNAAPYFRVMNPVTQGEKFDAEGVFVRRWVTELSKVHTKYIHSPWLMPTSEQTRTRCVIGRDYPHPIVDHDLAREATILAYKAALNR